MLAEATSAATGSKAEIITALRQACAVTGTDFDYLLGTAMRESSLKPQAKSNTSSATGLFQFIDQTWLGLVKQHGAQYGLGSYANAISQGPDGRYRTACAADRQAILALRTDPKVSALMAGEYVNQTRDTLEGTLGRDVCNGELYAAHFLGPDAACKLIQLSQRQPDASAADAFPRAASANRNVFYHRDGTEKSVREVYNWALKHASGDAASTPAKTAAAKPQAAKPSYNLNVGSSFDNWAALQLASIGGGDDFSGALCAIPRNPFALTPGVVDILASMTPDREDKVN